MHGNRRRKKRPSYGVRTVEITKGHNGFGFTISGQAPCILSCIVPGSPAEKAGLRPGDYIIAVNGQNVSKAPHDDVVRLIGQSKLLKLQIAENYYSDSSDDEFTVNRPKPKYPNRLRHKHQQTRAEKVVRDLQSGAIFSEHAAIHNSENAPLSDRDWMDSYTPPDPFLPAPPTSISVTVSGAGNMVVNASNPSSTSPTRLRPDQIRIVMAEARQVPRNSRPMREEAPIHPPRVRQALKKREKILKGKNPINLPPPKAHQSQTVQQQMQQDPQKVQDHLPEDHSHQEQDELEEQLLQDLPQDCLQNEQALQDESPQETALQLQHSEQTKLQLSQQQQHMQLQQQSQQQKQKMQQEEHQSQQLQSQQIQQLHQMQHQLHQQSKDNHQLQMRAPQQDHTDPQDQDVDANQQLHHELHSQKYQQQQQSQQSQQLKHQHFQHSKQTEFQQLQSQEQQSQQQEFHLQKQHQKLQSQVQQHRQLQQKDPNSQSQQFSQQHHHQHHHYQPQQQIHHQQHPQHHLHQQSHSHQQSQHSQQQQLIQPQSQQHQQQQQHQQENQIVSLKHHPMLPPQQPLQQKQNFQHQHLHNNRHAHKHFQKPIISPNIFQSQKQQFQENVPPHQHLNLQPRPIHQHENSQIIKSYPQQPFSAVNPYTRHQQFARPLIKQSSVQNSQSELYHAQLTHAYGTDSSCNAITEQEINNLLYPTLAEIQQNQIPPEDMGEVIYRAVVGYLGTIEMPKEPQGGSRLTAIRNCIRRLRIEKKVHTLVLMSIFSEQVVLTNPHGLTLAEYPAERITFCGVYADDKKFFGLVTVHGNSGDELSDGSQDEGNDPAISSSSSCHVFMVDPNAVQHPDHCRRAKNFRVDCTPAPAQEDGTSYCLEFPDSADPILHSIMSLYRNRVGFHLDTGAPGLIDVDAQMSPQHSNTSSNSSNSDSGIGFRDEGGHHYHNSDRVFVVEFDDNQRTRLQNVQILGNLRVGVNDSARVSAENQRLNLSNSVSNSLGNFAGETSDNNVPSIRNIVEKNSLPLNMRPMNGENVRPGNSEGPSKVIEFQRATHKQSNSRVNDVPHLEVDENLRVSVSDPKKLKELRTSLSEGKISLTDGRTSVTEELRATEDISDPLLTPNRDCTSPQDGNRLTVRAMPDPVSFERSPGYFLGTELPIQVSSMRHSMHKYLQHKQEHLVKVSQKINRRESDSGSVPHPLSVRAFSPATGKRTPTPSLNNSQMQQNLDLSLKLSPKVFGVPFRSSAPSEHSFTRSLEDLRDSSTSDGVSGSMGVSGGSFRDGSESDQGLARLLHASETNLVRCSPTRAYNQDAPRGAFRAVHPRSHRNNPVGMLPVGVLPRVGRLSDVGAMRVLPCLGSIGSVNRPMDSGDENTETTENTGGQGGSQDVHPPTQDEFSHDSDSEQVEGSEGKKPRGVSLRRHSRARHANDRHPLTTSDSNATQSDTEVGKISGPIIQVSNGSLASDSQLEMSRVGAWAASFEKLIEDPAGLHTFAEFLKKEYSHENIYFWTACERYKMITDEEERREMARAIFDRHLGMAASEAVNVDSHARQIAQEGLSNPDEFLFSAAQKQIFNLMKFDSYSRFLKSDLYNKCLTQDRKGLPLPYPGDDTLDPNLSIYSENQFSKNLKKSKSDAEERRRKSLLPWHRKDRSKSKDRGETEYWRRRKLGHRTPSDSSSARYDLSDSHTSLSSSDFAPPGHRAVSKESLTSGEAASLSGSEGIGLCRFILPDKSNSVLAVKSGETVKELVRPLLDRRRINFTEFDVVLTKGNKSVDLNKDSTILSGLEARLERMVLFSLYLPSRKTVIVKAKPHKLISEVLKPILSKYGLKLDLMVIHKHGDAKPINVKGPVTDLDGEKLTVQTKEEIKEWSDPSRHSKRNTRLDEITNKVFEDLLNGRNQSHFDDLGVLDFDSRSTKTDPTSDTSSSLLGSFSRRESLSLERNLPTRQSGGGRGLHHNLPFGGKRRDPPTFTITSKRENAALYEGLTRAQMCRLDDQRGTEINFELPEFLKSDRTENTKLLSHFDRSFHSASSDGMEQSEFLSRAHPEVWGGVQGSPGGDTTLIASVDLDLDDLEETLRPIENDKRHNSNNNNISNTNNNNISNNSINNINNNKNNSSSTMTSISQPSPFLTPPPPLPPKPKLGGALRGPPPRPPSRQLPPLSNSLHLLDVPIQKSLADKFSVSFV